ncbi:F-box/LRR-repeat protein 3-like isoform X2 [Malania oleifera]|uniref:F-box/LRR-repeat protein 3-like isoform X2 n=1 Tax=Malania oleifera TaxID=397392 RepID=UPI0025AEBCD4|nr:F-box/LRR-repeat protein 3-like isoform X2 [Malania oleifera]
MAFDAVNEEILHAILDRLHDPLDRKSFSLVCKLFNSVESQHRKTLTPLRIDLLRRTLARYPFLQRLDFTQCPRVDDASLDFISESCKSTLRSINLSRSRHFTSAGISRLVLNCSELVEIDLSNGMDITDTAAASIAEAKNLEKLSLGRCKLVSDIGIGCVAVGCRKLRVVCLRWCLRVTDLGVALIAMKCKEIRALDLSYLPITSKCLQPILQLQHLKDLVLVGCLGIDDNGLATLKHGCNSLEKLNIANCQNITHVGLSPLTRGTACLHQLSLAYGSVVTADLGKCPQNFSELQSVKLDGCLVTCSGMMTIGNWCASLKELSVSKCLGVTDEGLSPVVRKHKELRKLDITCCRKITHVSIDSLTSLCSFLTSLRMESCSLVSKEAFVLIGRCEFLEELDVTDNEIDDEGLKSISRCRKLSSLKLGICPNVTDGGLTHIGLCCPKLTELDLYRSVGISDVGIAAIARGCPALEMINIAYCSNVTDASLVSLSKCLRLKILEIRGCSCVSLVGLSTIAMGCRRLTMLDIKKCYNINDSGMLSLAQFSHDLKQINLSNCSVTDVGLLAVASIGRLQNLTILNLTGLSPSGLMAALSASRGLMKVKLHSSFKRLLPRSLLGQMEASGCVFQWRDKAFQHRDTCVSGDSFES